MKEYKNKLAIFLKFDYDGVQAFLEKMAARGWRFESTDRLIWRFRKAEPAEVHYRAVFLPETSRYHPENNPTVEEYDEYCRETGWTHVYSNDKMHIFCSEEADPVPIETDEELKLENVKKSMLWPFVIPMLVIFAWFCFLPLLAVVTDPDSAVDPIILFSSYASMLRTFGRLLVGAFAAVFLVSYWIWAGRSRKSIEAGGSCLPTTMFSRYYTAAVILVLAIAVLWAIAVFVENSIGFALIKVGSVLLIIAIIFFTMYLTVTMRREGVGKRKNQVATYIFAGVMIFFIYILSIIFLLLLPYEAAEAGMDSGNKDKMTLTSEDLRDIGDVEYTHDWKYTETIFMSDEYGEQYNIYGESNEYSLSYEVLKIKKEWLYDMCLKEWLKGREYEEVKVDGLHADAVYQYYWDGEPDGEWIFCYPNGMADVAPLFDTEEGDLQKIDQIMYDALK